MSRLVPNSSLVAAVCFAFLLFLPGKSVPFEHTFKIATIAPDESYWGDFARKAKMYVENRSKGRAKILWYMSGVMGDEPEVIEKMESGELQGAVLTLNGLGIIQPAIRAVALPFLFRSFEEVDYVFKTMDGDFKRLFEEKGYSLLGFTEVGFVRVFSQDPIRNIEDISRMRMWSWEEWDLLEVIFQELGFTQLLKLPVQEVYSNLKANRIDSFCSTCYALLSVQWYQIAEYMSDFDLGYGMAGLVVKQDFFASVPKDVQYIIYQGTEFMTKPMTELIRRDEAKACVGLKKRGMKEHASPPELVRELERRSERFYYKYADKKYPRDLIEKMIGEINEFRSQ